jgi:hypothetical protein
MSSLAEIRQAIEKLAPKERAELRRWLDAQDIEESPEFLAAVDEGNRFSIFAMRLAIMIMGQSRPWSDRYLFSAFNAFQRLSTLFNAFQRLSTSALLAMLKRVELLSAVAFRTSLEGRSTRSVGREFFGLKRSVRMHGSK